VEGPEGMPKFRWACRGVRLNHIKE